MIKILAATKSEATEDRVVSWEEGAGLAARHGIKFFEVSAKTGLNVNAMFLDIAD